MQPVIIIDRREQAPLAFPGLPFVVDTLLTGDYSISGAQELFAVERKSIADLVSCCMGANRQRFERELHRLRGFRFKRLLVVGSQVEVEQHRYGSALSPKAVLSTLAAFEVRYDTPVVWADTPEQAAQMVESWVWWFARELLRQTSGLTKAIPNQAGLPTAKKPQLLQLYRSLIFDVWRPVPYIRRVAMATLGAYACAPTGKSSLSKLHTKPPRLP